MNVEIGALLQKDIGPKIVNALQNFKGIKSITIESGRSSDLFNKKQFGDFGEASILSIIADTDAKTKIFDAVYDLCEFNGEQNGIVFMSSEFVKAGSVKDNL